MPCSKYNYGKRVTMSIKAAFAPCAKCFAKEVVGDWLLGLDTGKQKEKWEIREAVWSVGIYGGIRGCMSYRLGELKDNLKYKTRSANESSSMP